MKVRDLLGDSYSIPVETNQVIKAMLNKVAKELFYDNHYSQGYEAITREGIPLGNNVNEVFFLKQGEQTSMFGSLTNSIAGSNNNNSYNIQASCLFNEHEIKKAIRDDLDLQDVYDRMLKNLRTSLLIQRRDKFLIVLGTYLSTSKDIPYFETEKLSDMLSILFQGFQTPTTKFNPFKGRTQCFEEDIICLANYTVLGKMLNEHDTPFINWLRFNNIVEETLPVNVNGEVKNPDVILFDKRAFKILVNDRQFSYFFNPNSLTYTITYTENINIVANKASNLCVIKEQIGGA